MAFCPKQETYKLEKLQMKALRYILIDFTSTYEQLLDKGDKRPLYMTRIHKIVELMYKFKNDSCPDYLNSFINSKVPHFNLSNKEILCIPQFKSVTHGQNSFKCHGPYYWNVLPNNIKCDISLNSFKEKLQTRALKCNCGFCVMCNIFKL